MYSFYFETFVGGRKWPIIAIIGHLEYLLEMLSLLLSH
jgi:hypothetical protein